MGALAVIACLFGAAVPFALARGGSGWSVPAQISSSASSGEHADLPDVALGAGGEMAAVWLDEAGSQTRLHASVNDGGGFSAPQSLGAADPWSDGSGDRPAVAEDGSGDAVAVWIDGGKLLAASDASGRTSFGTPITLDGSGVDSEPHVVMDHAGDALAVWAQEAAGSWSVNYAVRPAGSDWGAPTQLAGGLSSDPQPAVAVNQSSDPSFGGGAAIAYVDQGVGILSSFLGSIGDPSSELFPTPEHVFPYGDGSSDETLTQPAVTVSADGTVDVAWVDASSGLVWENHYAGPTGTVNPNPDWISAASDQSDPAIATNQTVHGDNSTAVAFASGVVGGDDSVVAAIEDSTEVDGGEGWETLTVPTSIYPASAPQQPGIAVSSNDTVAMLWQAPGSGGGTQVDEISSLGGGAGVAGSFPDLPPIAITDGVTVPTCAAAACSVLAADAAGDLVAAWLQYDTSTNAQVEVACGGAGASAPGDCVPAPAGTPPSSPPTTTTSTTGAPTTSTPTTPSATTTSPTTSSTQSTPPPVPGQSSDLARSSGTILIKLPGSNRFVRVSSTARIPLGTVVDATHGTVTLSFALPDGKLISAKFWGGEFTVSQAPSGAVSVKLTGGSFSGCPRPPRRGHALTHRLAHAAKAKTKKKKTKSTAIRSLWSNAHGSFTTKGNYGSAAVLGTTWLTRDQCDGTYFRVTHTSADPHGEIRVTIYHPHRHTILLKQGHSLLAPAPGYP